MGVFNTKERLLGSPALIPTIANEIVSHFQNKNYEVFMDALSSGGYDISISKGNIFKAVLGMKTALKITLLPQKMQLILRQELAFLASRLYQHSSCGMWHGLCCLLKYGVWCNSQK